MADELHQLLKRVQAGDAQAQSELVQRYWPEIHRVAEHQLRRSRLRRVFGASELCNLVFKSFLSYVAAADQEHLGQMAGAGNVRRLLRRIAEHKWIDQLRVWVQRLESEQPAQESYAQRADDQAGAVEAVAEREFCQWVLRQLPPRDRQLVVMRILEGRGWEEIGGQCGLSADAARIRCARALRWLRDRLEPDQPTE